MGLPTGLLDCPHNVVAGFSQNEGSRRQSEKEAALSFVNLFLEVVLWHFQNILLVAQVSPVQHRSGAYTSVSTRRQRSLGPTEGQCHVMVYCSSGHFLPILLDVS